MCALDEKSVLKNHILMRYSDFLSLLNLFGVLTLDWGSFKKIKV